MMRLQYAAALLLGLVPSLAWADAATHDLTLETKTLAKTDCGGGSCVPACMISATLKTTKSGPDKTAPLLIELWYQNKNIDELRPISLSFDSLAKGKVSKAVDHVAGHRCKDIKVRRVAVECPMEKSDRCPGFYYVQVPKVSVLGLDARKIEGK